ncbi:hypothetical protein VIBC2010_14249 [Vibrio caribbeanicus ATCC BAA-2122]|uniref:Uncharacterized protein n=1 Tax=Vibrio caribbeanicus ATCC BAA-2122 TaxID=796620 RepID=E3BLG9_9VIBR|nr:hypothetical protein VIBC2010_14249 [Vibrio caribbeanicus ATCC BAA-2122]
MIEKEIFANATGAEKRVKWKTIKLDVTEITRGKVLPRTKSFDRCLSLCSN